MAKRTPRPRRTTLPGIFRSDSPGQTKALGRALARRLTGGDLVLLKGNLGSGKTTFVQGMFEGLGILEYARSSSFILVNEYRSKRGKLYHIDLYRLEGQEIEGIGLEEYLYGSGIVVVEWAERLAAPLSRAYWEITLRPTGAEEREIEIRRRDENTRD